jgi:hypothetical protein
LHRLYRQNRRIAFLLTVLLGLGGLLLPVAHELRHIGQDAHRHEVADQRARAAGPDGHHGADGWLVDEPFRHATCVLCATFRPYLGVQVPATPPLHTVAFVPGSAPERPGVPLFASLPIRGPPAAA